MHGDQIMLAISCRISHERCHLMGKSAIGPAGKVHAQCTVTVHVESGVKQTATHPRQDRFCPSRPPSSNFRSSPIDASSQSTSHIHPPPTSTPAHLSFTPGLIGSTSATAGSDFVFTLDRDRRSDEHARQAAPIIPPHIPITT